MWHLIVSIPDLCTLTYFVFRGSWVTDYKVDVSLDGGSLENKTNDYVSTTNCRTQDEPDQYGTVWITENVDQVKLRIILNSLKLNGISHYYQLEESIFNFRGVGLYFFFILFFFYIL